MPPDSIYEKQEVQMSVDYYQRSVNSLDKDIAALEKKKAEAEKSMPN